MAEGLLNYTRLDDPDDVICTTQGRPLSEGDEVRLVDEHDRDVPDGEPGSLLTRGPYTPRGYYRAAEQNARAFTADGWYRSGDIVRRRRDGNLVVEGRDKDMINRGGEKISAEEVENLVYQLPQVAQVAAVAMPDPELGERVCVYAVLMPGAALTLDAVRAAMTAAGSPASSGPSGSSSFPNCPPPRSARSTRRRCAPTSPRGWPATEGGNQDDQPERRDDRRRLRQPRAPGQARRALPGLRRGGYDAAVADPRGPDAVPSRTARGTAPVAVGKAVPAGRPQRRPGAGRTGRRAPRHRTGQSRPARRPLRHAHAVGRHPVPRPAGERARAPAHPVRVPVRPGRRGRVDRRRRRPGGHAPRRPAAHPGMALPRAPERLRRPDGVARWPGHPARRHHGPGLLRVRSRTSCRTPRPRTAAAASGCGAAPAWSLCRPRASRARPPR